MLDRGLTCKDYSIGIGNMTTLKKLLTDNRIWLSRGGHHHQASTQTNPSIILYLSSLIMELIETSNACLGLYFGADKHFMAMMIIVTVRLILLGTIVTLRRFRPLVLFLNKITMDILTEHRHSHWHRKSVSSVFTCRHNLQLAILLFYCILWAIWINTKEMWSLSVLMILTMPRDSFDLWEPCIF